MEAALCLRVPQPAAKKARCLLSGVKPSSVHGHKHLLLGFVAHIATSSGPLLSNSLHAALDRRPGALGMRASGSPAPSADDDDKVSSHSKPKERGLAIGAAVALVCFTGIVCWKQGLLARAAPGWPWSPPTPTQSDVWSSPEERDLLGLLEKAKSTMKLQGRIDSTFLIKSWEKEEHLQEKYEQGLSLIEILINWDEYVNAQRLCDKLKPIAIKGDGRLPLRMFIVDLCQQLQDLRVGKLQNPRQKVDELKKKWEEYTKNYPSGPPSFPF